MHPLSSNQTLLISGLFHPKRPKEIFSARITTDPPENHYTFVQLPAQSFMAINAYDGYLIEQSKKRMITHQPLQYVMPALRADDAFTDDFIDYWQKWMSETGEEPPTRHSHQTTDYYNDIFAIAKISHNFGRLHYANGYHRTRMFYLFGAKKIPLFADKHSLPQLEARLAQVERRIQNRKTLFS